ncbi:MAG: VWA domain-containing protein [Thermacetogeniaceae bacterium]
MEAKILEFCRLLRRGGINVSFTQIVGVLQAVSEVGFCWNDFYIAMSSILIADHADQPLFDRLFHLYFRSLQASNATNSSVEIAAGDSASTVAELAGSADGSGIGRGAGASPFLLLIRAVKENNRPLLERLAQVAVNSLGPLARTDLQNMDETLVRAKVAIGWYEGVNRLERTKLLENLSEIAYDRWITSLGWLEDRIEQLLGEHFVSLFGSEALDDIATAANLKEKEFYRLDNLEVEEIRRRITKLARKLASKYARRYRRAKRGEIDMRRTARQALLTGGTPVRLRYRQKKISKPELAVLCDVSGSVAVFSEFMLQLVYTIQNRFRAVRSFLFVDVVDEATLYFKNEDIEAALGEAFAKAYFSYSGFSDYGRVFTLFANYYLAGIDPRSTLIILGDARNNWRLDERDYFQKIADHVRRIIWFNPQPRDNWDKEDSIMQVYAPYCRQVFECRNLRQLEDLIEAIL